MWVAALTNAARIFVNHPGKMFDASSMLPCYWYGNGVMPVVEQTSGCIVAVYSIPDEHPNHFTHVFHPRVKFDSIADDGSWIFARIGNGGLAFWCSSAGSIFR